MIRFDPAHGGYPGEIIIEDEYLQCIWCGWSFPLECGEDRCTECNGLLMIKRAQPAPESTARLFR